MISMKVVLAVGSREYIEPLLNYVHGSEFAKRMNVTAFSQPEAFLQYMTEETGSRRPDVIVGEEIFLRRWTEREASGIPCLLLNEGGLVNTQAYGQSLQKYQPLSELLDSILEASRQQAIAYGMGRNREATLIVGIVSASGGLGKTTAALNIAKQLGSQGHSVFYLNLETVDSSSLFTSIRETPTGSEGLSRLLYDMKADKVGQPEWSVTSYCVRQNEFKADTFQPLDNRKELMDMTRVEAADLIRLIAEHGQYDVVVVDGESGACERSQAVLDVSDELIWLLADDLVSMLKCRLWMDILEASSPETFEELIGKTRFIVNRYMGTMVNQPPQDYVQIDGILPYIPSWKQMDRQELLLTAPIYQRAIGKLCTRLLGEEDTAEYEWT